MTNSVATGRKIPLSSFYLSTLIFWGHKILGLVRFPAEWRSLRERNIPSGDHEDQGSHGDVNALRGTRPWERRFQNTE